MIAEKIKKIRTQKGLSQEKLAEKTNLSLRTIQRVENGESDPRGDTLIRIADALNISLDIFNDSQKEENKAYLASIHISALSFLLFPLLGIILPLILWIAKKDKIKNLNSQAKELLNFQISWTLLLFLGLLGYLFWWGYKMGSITDVSPSIVIEIYFPLYIIIGGLYAYNLIIICYNILRVGLGKKIWYNPKINFLP